MLDSGTELAGYRIQSLLGEGGMGVVYLATHTLLEREVALKIIAPQHRSDADFRERFIRESRLAASLEHPNVLPIYDAGEADGQLYLAMRYVPGGDLRTLLREQGRLSALLAIEISRQIALALDAAHRAGLVHRDVKPANVLLDSADHVFLSDFGLARQLTSTSTRTGMVIGTPDYSSPEQLEGVKALDGRADIYSLGCVLYNCLAGQPPFVRESEVGVITAHLRDAAPDLGMLRPDLPASLSRLVSTAMAKDRVERFPTGAAFTDALASVRSELESELALGETSPASMGGSATPPPPTPPSGKTIIDRVGGQAPLAPIVAQPQRSSLQRVRDAIRGSVEQLQSRWSTLGALTRRLLLIGGGAALLLIGALVAGIELLGGGGAHPTIAEHPPAAPAQPVAVSRVLAAAAIAGKGLDRAAKLQFTVPATHATPVTRVEFRTTGAKSGAIPLPGQPLQAPTHEQRVVHGLKNGVPYAFSLRACNESRCGPWSPFSNRTTPYGQPRAPAAHASASGTRIAFGWSGGGGSGRPIARYEVQIDGGRWQKVGSKPGHLAATYGYGQAHEVRARVVDTTGQTSVPSSRASARTVPAPAPRSTPVPKQPPTLTTVNQ